MTPLLLCVLWVRNRGLWGRYVRMVLALSAAGLATYVLYPAAPPWLAAKDGVIPRIHRMSGVGWDVLGIPRAGALLAELTCLVLLPVARRVWQRVAWWAMPC